MSATGKYLGKGLDHNVTGMLTYYILPVQYTVLTVEQEL